MKLQKHPTFLTNASYRVLSEAPIICGRFCYTKREALIQWLEGLAEELDRCKCSEEDVIKALKLEEIESEEL